MSETRASYAVAFSAMREVKSAVGMDEVFALFFDPLGRGIMNTLLFEILCVLSI